MGNYFSKSAVAYLLHDLVQANPLPWVIVRQRLALH